MKACDTSVTKMFIRVIYSRNLKINSPDLFVNQDCYEMIHLIKFVMPCPPPPFLKKKGAFCFAPVGWSVSDSVLTK